MPRPNGSMAIWCATHPTEAEVSFEAHLNYWRVAGQKRKGSAPNEDDFLEIGILITNPLPVTGVNIFLPLELSLERVTDLGPKFSMPDIAQGIFNEVLSCSAQYAGNNWINLTRQDLGLFCRVHCFARDANQRIDRSEMILDHQDGGTLLRILPAAIAASANSLGNEGKLYVRLRVLMGGKRTSPFVKLISPTDRPLQSGFDEIEYIDFRLNESRTLPDSIERMIRRDTAGGFALNKFIAFLAAVPVASELTVSHTQFHKNRLLEETPWTAYAPNPLPEGMMVYHWKKVSSINIDSFTAFVKLQTRKTGRSTIIKYLAVAFVFGVLGNLAASGLEAGASFIASKILGESPATQAAEHGRP